MNPFHAWFESLGPVSSALVVVGGLVLVTLVAGRTIARFASHDLLRDHNDLAGFIFAVVGVVYAVVLGFISVGVWDRFAEATQRTSVEADALVTAYRSAADLPDSQSVRRDLKLYAADVVSREWPAMERGVANHQTDAAAERLGEDADRIVPRATGDQNLASQVVANVDTSLTDRDLRLDEGVSGLNGVMWAVVFVGAAVTIGFSLLFGFRSAAMQSVMTGALACIIGLMVYLTLSLDYPYSGAIRVGPEAFERAIAGFSQIDATERR